MLVKAAIHPGSAPIPLPSWGRGPRRIYPDVSARTGWQGKPPGSTVSMRRDDVAGELSPRTTCVRNDALHTLLTPVTDENPVTEVLEEKVGW